MQFGLNSVPQQPVNPIYFNPARMGTQNPGKHRGSYVASGTGQVTQVRVMERSLEEQLGTALGHLDYLANLLPSSLFSIPLHS